VKTIGLKGILKKGPNITAGKLQNICPSVLKQSIPIEKIKCTSTGAITKHPWDSIKSKQ
jgi:hypothetical protein